MTSLKDELKKVRKQIKEIEEHLKRWRILEGSLIEFVAKEGLRAEFKKTGKIE